MKNWERKVDVWICDDMTMSEDPRGFVVERGEVIRKFRSLPTPEEASIMCESHFHVGRMRRGKKPREEKALWLVWGEKQPTSYWAKARLNFRPTPDEARAAIELSPGNGRYITPLYSKDQIHRFMSQSKNQQEEQITIAAQEAHCKHERCCWCTQEISCMEADRHEGKAVYHLRCWENEQVKIGWKARGLNIHAGTNLWENKDGAIKWWDDEKQLCHLYPDAESRSTVTLYFNPTANEARFCLKFPYIGTISRQLYVSLTWFDKAFQLMKKEGLTIDQVNLDQLASKYLHGGQNFDEFVAEREPKQDVTGLEEPEFHEGDVVFVRAMKKDYWAQECTGVVECADDDNRVRLSWRIINGKKVSAAGCAVLKIRCTLLKRREEL